ncbi:DUF6286 domain-containing protein [Streptomyces sp. 796.1]|uniref:DUF6286 domain-containing protein n=1 Tax=Streptomyces sp. 796.1 TaxID=3163029 RepID=UPI0039C90017
MPAAGASRRPPLLEKAAAGGTTPSDHGEDSPPDPAARPSEAAGASAADPTGTVDGSADGSAGGPADGAPPGPPAVAARYTPAPGAAERARRFWSPRRVPAAVLALVVLGASGLLLYDVAAVRADRTAMRWRRRLGDELASRPLDDVWVVTGAAVAVALGLWLLVLALTPGRRGVLPMRPDPQVRAGLDRSAAALVLRDRAMGVPGVRTVRVDAGRRRVTVRAQAHFRELDEVRSDLDAALDDGIRHLGLARRPGLRVQVRRPTKR